MTITKLEWQFLIGHIQMNIDANDPAGPDIDKILDKLGAPYGFTVASANWLTPEHSSGDAPEPEERLAEFIARPKLICALDSRNLREAVELYRLEQRLTEQALTEQALG